MRISILLILFIWSNTIFSQLIDLKKDWLTQEPFFNKSFIQKENIKAIHFRIRDKKDGKVMNNHSTFLHFLFNEKGDVISSFNSIPLSNRVDTSRINYTYENGNFIVREEEKGLFKFQYLFYYDNKNRLIKEVKLDVSKVNADTLYKRYFETIINKSGEIIVVMNESKNEFMSHHYQYNSDSLLIREQTSFSRNQNRIKKVYFYENSKLIEKSYAKNFGNKKFEKWEVDYTNENPDLIKVYRSGSIFKKIRFNYSENGKLTALIERDFENESIRLVEISYSLFNN